MMPFWQCFDRRVKLFKRINRIDSGARRGDSRARAAITAGYRQTRRSASAVKIVDFVLLPTRHARAVLIATASGLLLCCQVGSSSLPDFFHSHQTEYDLRGRHH